MVNIYDAFFSTYQWKTKNITRLITALFKLLLKFLSTYYKSSIWRKHCLLA